MSSVQTWQRRTSGHEKHIKRPPSHAGQPQPEPTRQTLTQQSKDEEGRLMGEGRLEYGGEGVKVYII